MTSHLPDHALLIFQRVAMMKNGNFLAVGKTSSHVRRKSRESTHRGRMITVVIPTAGTVKLVFLRRELGRRPGVIGNFGKTIKKYYQDNQINLFYHSRAFFHRHPK
jgi:ABC-type multidrug transport system ATPase subunit